MIDSFDHKRRVSSDEERTLQVTSYVLQVVLSRHLT